MQNEASVRAEACAECATSHASTREMVSTVAAIRVRRRPGVVSSARVQHPVYSWCVMDLCRVGVRVRSGGVLCRRQCGERCGLAPASRQQ